MFLLLSSQKAAITLLLVAKELVKLVAVVPNCIVPFVEIPKVVNGVPL